MVYCERSDWNYVRHQLNLLYLNPFTVTRGANMIDYNVFVVGYPDKCAYFEGNIGMRAYVDTLKDDGFRVITACSIANVYYVVMVKRE